MTLAGTSVLVVSLKTSFQVYGNVSELIRHSWAGKMKLFKNDGNQRGCGDTDATEERRGEAPSK